MIKNTTPLVRNDMVAITKTLFYICSIIFSVTWRHLTASEELTGMTRTKLKKTKNLTEFDTKKRLVGFCIKRHLNAGEKCPAFKLHKVVL